MAGDADSGYGEIRMENVPQPAAGGVFTHTTAGSVRELVLAVSFQLVTDGNAATRTVRLLYRDSGGVTVYAAGAPFTQAASLTTVYSFGLGGSVYGADDAGNIGAALPWLPLDVGSSIRLAITNVQVGDQVSAIRITKQQEPVRP